MFVSRGSLRQRTRCPDDDGGGGFEEAQAADASRTARPRASERIRFTASF
jgi:hypothetical protein